MSRTTIDIIKNDKTYYLNFTLQDFSGTPVSLENISTLKLKVQKPGADTVKFEGSMNVVNQEAGTCRYLVANGNFDTKGKYHAEIEATYTSGQIITWPDIIINVLSDLPK
jgi:hypothetical protein